MRTITTVVAALALALGGCGTRKGSAECKAFLARILECNPELETTGTAEQIQNGKDMLMRMCLDAMSGEAPAGPAPEMTANYARKVETCGPLATCAELNACVRSSR